MYSFYTGTNSLICGCIHNIYSSLFVDIGPFLYVWLWKNWNVPYIYKYTQNSKERKIIVWRRVGRRQRQSLQISFSKSFEIVDNISLTQRAIIISKPLESSVLLNAPAYSDLLVDVSNLLYLAFVCFKWHLLWSDYNRSGR